jgi:hypothetical protein
VGEGEKVWVNLSGGLQWIAQNVREDPRDALPADDLCDSQGDGAPASVRKTNLALVNQWAQRGARSWASQGARPGDGGPDDGPTRGARPGFTGQGVGTLNPAAIESQRSFSSTSIDTPGVVTASPIIELLKVKLHQ